MLEQHQFCALDQRAFFMPPLTAYISNTRFEFGKEIRSPVVVYTVECFLSQKWLLSFLVYVLQRFSLRQT